MTKKKNDRLQDDDGWGGYDWMQAFFGGVSRMTVYRWWKSGVISQPQYPTGSINKPFWWKRTVREQAAATAGAAGRAVVGQAGRDHRPGRLCDPGAEFHDDLRA
jgi:hypothetical protein